MNLRKKNRTTQTTTQTNIGTKTDEKKESKDKSVQSKMIDYVKLSKLVSIILIWAICTFLVFSALTLLEYSKKNEKNSELNVLANYYLPHKQQTAIIDKTSLERFWNKYNWNINITSEWAQVSDLYSLVQKMFSIKEQNFQKLSSLQKPYTLFLSNIYFPRLNIWKDPYSNDINLFLWYEFLQKNSLMDTNLFAYWSDYFRNVWDKFEQNDLKDINISSINQNSSWFNYQVSVKLDGSRRSFLALMDKLSLTSNPNSISLINEFVFRLWEEAKKNPLLNEYKDKDLAIWEIFYKSIKISEDLYNIREVWEDKYIDINVQWKTYWFKLNTSFLDSLDDKIWKNFEYKKFANDSLVWTDSVFSKVQDLSKTLSNWDYLVLDTKNNKEISQQLSENVQQINFQYKWNIFSLVRKWNEIVISPTYKQKFFLLINDKIIFDTIKNVSSCKEEWSSQNCLYIFREKYRSIPSLAYTIGQYWTSFDKDYRTQSLYNFLYSLPPILNVDSFEFKKSLETQNLASSNQSYSTTISLSTYGTSFSSEELIQLSSYLWSKCFQNSTSELNPSIAIEKISNSLSISANLNADMETMKTYMDLKNIIERLSKTYSTLPNYDKSIKLVEIYRMMKDAWLCNK